MQQKNRNDPERMKEETVGIPPPPHSPPPLKRTYKEDWREGCTIKKRTAGPHYFASRTVDCTSGVTCISFPFCFISYMHSLFFSFHRTKTKKTSSLSCVEALFMKNRYGLCSLPGKMNFLCTHGHIFVSSSFPLYHWSVIKNTYGYLQSFLPVSYFKRLRLWAEGLCLDDQGLRMRRVG